MAAPRKKKAGAGKAGRSIRPIVSSAHLVSETSAELSEFEFGLIIADNAFSRWSVRCMAAAGVPDLGALDVLVLHGVNHRARDKKLADICLVLNVEDVHTVSYSLKKLIRMGLVGSRRKGKEVFYTTTPEGKDACERYREVREECLVKSLRAFGDINADIRQVADLMRALSGLYDQAARSATSL